MHEKIAAIPDERLQSTAGSSPPTAVGLRISHARGATRALKLLPFARGDSPPDFEEEASISRRSHRPVSALAQGQRGRNTGSPPGSPTVRGDPAEWPLRCCGIGWSGRGPAVILRVVGHNMQRMLSRRVLGTDTPVMVQMQELLRGTTDVVSLAQGIVHWQPPAEALKLVKADVDQPVVSKYGADDGMPELKKALLEKLERENKIRQSSVMVTAGANQAVVNLVLALCDPGDAAAMFIPYYFNAYMAFQMTGVTDILLGPSDPQNFHPDADWLEETLKKKDGKKVPSVVYIVNPGNPSGTYVPDPLLKRISELCRQAGTWLIVDNTYEYFMYDGRAHTCEEGDHIVNVFSFSKSYGMMGWRIGYIAYPTAVEGIGAQLLKVQDNIPICASIIGQRLALASLASGPDWVRQRVKKLGENRALVLDALAPLGEDAVKGGEGAIYLWARLPKIAPDDVAVTKWLVGKHHVSVIPGSASGGPGYIRVSYGGLDQSNCRIAASRLKKGLQELVEHGMQEQ